jgi:uncharacterized protein YqhQ
MDENRHKIFVFLMFFMAISHVKEIKNLFNYSQTSIKAQPKEKQKMKKDEMKKEKIEFLV